MSPLQGESAMMRTFNASTAHNTGEGFFRTRHSMPNSPLQKSYDFNNPSQFED